MSNNEHTHSDESEIVLTGDITVNKGDTIAKSVEEIVKCDEYSSIEDLLNIDNFITQTDKNDDNQCSGYDNLETNLMVINSEIDCIQVPSLSEDTIAPDGSKQCTTDNNIPTTLSISLMAAKDKLMTTTVTNVGYLSNEAINIDANLANSSANTSASSDHSIPTENKIDSPSVSGIKSTKISKAQNKHFPQFIKLYCAKCGEGPWNSRFHSNPKCPTCENKILLRCYKCKQESDSYECIVYHLKTKCAPNNVKYECSQCEYNTFLKTSLKLHIKTHEPSKNIICPDCGISVLKSKKSLENHKRYHCPNRHQVRDFKCSSCCKDYKYEKHLRKHEEKCFYVRGRAKDGAAESTLPNNDK